MQAILNVTNPNPKSKHIKSERCSNPSISQTKEKAQKWMSYNASFRFNGRKLEDVTIKAITSKFILTRKYKEIV